MVCCCFAATAALAQRAPLTLKQAITLALQNSSELALAKARYAVAAQQEAQARAAFRPNLFTGSGAAYTYGFPMAPGGSAPSLFNLSYVQTVFNPPLRGQAKAPPPSFWILCRCATRSRCGAEREAQCSGSGTLRAAALQKAESFPSTQFVRSSRLRAPSNASSNWKAARKRSSPSFAR
jgi:hypothetical protein